MKFGLIITAGGMGSRFGSENGKQFIDIQGTPMIIYTLNKFLDLPDISQIIITIEKNKQESLKNLLKKLPSKPDIQIVEGGQTRKDSVANAFHQLKGVDMVIIHDGARPLVSKTLINQLMQKAKTQKAVIPVIPVVDTIKLVKNEQVIKTLPRDELYKVQTPQIIQYKIYKEALLKNKGTVITDDASLLENAGYLVHTVPGEQSNIKITYPQDLILAKTFLKQLRGLS